VPLGGGETGINFIGSGAHGTVSSVCCWILTLPTTVVLSAQVIESMTAGQPVVRVLVVLPVQLDVGLVGGGGPKA
jgi:hypothetical protein